MWTTAAFILIGVSIGYGVYEFRKRKTMDSFRERELLTEDEIFSRFYSDTKFDKKDVLVMWKEVAEVFRVPYGVLRPSDQFGKQLHGYWLIDNEVDELSDRAHNRLKGTGKSLDLHEISSLDEYVIAMLNTLSEVEKDQ